MKTNDICKILMTLPECHCDISQDNLKISVQWVSTICHRLDSYERIIELLLEKRTQKKKAAMIISDDVFSDNQAFIKQIVRVRIATKEIESLDEQIEELLEELNPSDH